MKYHFRIHREKKGYWAEGIELTGCRSQGRDLAALMRNLKEALHLFLSEPKESRVIFPEPRQGVRGSHVLVVAVSPRVAFAVLLRQMRLRAGFTQREVAEKIGFSGLYSYQKLENARTANPVLDTLTRLKNVFPDLDLNDILE